MKNERQWRRSPRRPTLWLALGLAILQAACAGPAGGPHPGTSATHAPDRTLAVAGTSTPAAGDWDAYMGDAARSGAGPTSPIATRPRRTWTAAVEGEVYAEPLVSGLSVIVATEQNWVYSLQATNGAPTWRTRLGDPVPSAKLECGHIDPNGVTSTPVIDPRAGILYVVAMLDSPVRHELYALRLADGAITWHRVVDPPGGDPGHHQQRGSLNLAGGRVYFSYGGFTGDCGDYHGAVVSAPTDGLGPLGSWVVPSENRGAIWAAPGPLVGPSGEVWVSTADTDRIKPDDKFDSANSVVRLSADLTSALDSWTPKNWAELNRRDIDLGSGNPALLPGGLAFITGKDGIGYLLKADHLGGIGGEIYSAQVCQTGGPTGGAFGGDAVVGEMVYVPCKDGLIAVRVNAAAGTFKVAWSASKIVNSPIFAYGRVWTVASDNGFHRNPGWNGTLVGLDPATGVVKASLYLGPIPHFASPAAAGGSIYVSGLGGVYAVSVG